MKKTLRCCQRNPNSFEDIFQLKTQFLLYGYFLFLINVHYKIRRNTNKKYYLATLEYSTRHNYVKN